MIKRYKLALALAPPTDIENIQFFRLVVNGRISPPGVRIVVQILDRPKIQQWRANEGHYAEIFRRKKSCHLEEATATA